MTIRPASRKRLIDAKGPYPPFGLRARNFFVKQHLAGPPIFMKKIYSEDQKQKGAVVMAPGIASNANLFRVRVNGEALTLDHDESFANLLAASGYTVYLFHPSYCERVINRYVIRHCKTGNLYGEQYRAPYDLTFDRIVEDEVPFVVDAAFKDCGEKPISWIGFSLGGMLMYAYLPEDTNGQIKNVVTIGSPVSLENTVGSIIYGINSISGYLGLEEKLMTDSITNNLVPLTNTLSLLPGWILRYNPILALIINPTNISNQCTKSLFNKVVEPIPAGLERSFVQIIKSGRFVSLDKDVDYLQRMQDLDSSDRNFLFIHGEKDLLVSKKSVEAAHDALTPNDPNNICEVAGAGHDDLAVGITSEVEVWQTALNWLDEHPIG